MGRATDLEPTLRKILRDIKVEASSEFDRNFTRQGFFSSAWARHKKGSPYEGGHILLKSGQLRRNIRSRSDSRSITFSSDLPYAVIHNQGGKIKVTRKMKSYFWARYYQATGSFVRRKNGELSRSKKQLRLSSEAEFWKAMALMKVGSEITIPQRKFLGNSPELKASVKQIIEDNIEEYCKGIAEELQEKKV